MKQVINGHIRHTTYPWQDQPHITFDTLMEGQSDPTDGEYTVTIRAHSITVDVPENFNPIPQKVAALMPKKQKIQADAHIEATKVEEQIQTLLALTYEAQA